MPIRGVRQGKDRTPDRRSIIRGRILINRRDIQLHSLVPVIPALPNPHWHAGSIHPDPSADGFYISRIHNFLDSLSVQVSTSVRIIAWRPEALVLSRATMTSRCRVKGNMFNDGCKKNSLYTINVRIIFNFMSDAETGYNRTVTFFASQPTRFYAGRLYLIVLLVYVFSACQDSKTADNENIDSQNRIQPYSENLHYLAWGDVPVFPLGSTGYHSWTPISRPGTVDFIEQMDRLATVIEEINSQHVVGFMRSLPYDPMNHLHDGYVEKVLQPWARLGDGRFDLEHFEPKWEERFLDYLDAALDRRIVIAVEIWDDWSVTRGPGGEYDPGEGAAWNANPFNPLNNVNYDEDVFPVETAVCNAPFYSTIPSRDNIEPVLALQKRYVDKILEIVSGYPNVIINISNESRAHLEWSRFWAVYIRENTPESMMIGEMPSTNRVDGGGECEDEFSPLTLSTEPGYSFVDAAQGVSGHEFGDAREQAIGGGLRLNEYRRVMAEEGTVKPVIVSKDYTRGPAGGDIVLWSRFVGGAAAARFHRLGEQHGPEISEFQHEAVRRLGAFIAQVPFWEMHPAPDLLDDLPNAFEANILASDRGSMVIQLLGEITGESRLSLNLEPGTWTVQWIDPALGVEIDQFEIIVQTQPHQLDIPGEPDHRVLYIKP